MILSFEHYIRACHYREKEEPTDEDFYRWFGYTPDAYAMFAMGAIMAINSRAADHVSADELVTFLDAQRDRAAQRRRDAADG